MVVYPLQAAAKKAAGKEQEQGKKDEKERADSEDAASCANIKHIWQLEPVEFDFNEDATNCIRAIDDFVKENCETMADQLYKEPDLQSAMSSKSIALDGAYY